jgi:hypothetical protein
MGQWSAFAEEPQQVVDADPAPSPTYAIPTPGDAAARSHVRHFGHELARTSLAIVLLLVGVITWVLLAAPAGVLGCVGGLAVSGAIIAGILYTLRASLFRRW